MSVARPGSTLPLTCKPEEGCIVWRSICSTSHSKIPKWFACGTLEWTTRGWNQYLARSIQSCRRKLFHELEGWIIVWLRNKKDVMKWTFIHPRISKALGYYWRCTCLLEFEWTRMGKIGQEEKKGTGGERKGGGKGEEGSWGSEVRPINKQRIDFLPLSAVPGETPSPPPSGYTHLHLC